MDDSSHRFLLKVWREPGPRPAWRATLRDVNDGSLHEFEATEALLAYLVSLDDDGANESGPWEGRLE